LILEDVGGQVRQVFLQPVSVYRATCTPNYCVLHIRVHRLSISCFSVDCWIGPRLNPKTLDNSCHWVIRCKTNVIIVRSNMVLVCIRSVTGWGIEIKFP